MGYNKLDLVRGPKPDQPSGVAGRLKRESFESTAHRLNIFHQLSLMVHYGLITEDEAKDKAVQIMEERGKRLSGQEVSAPQPSG